MSIKDELWQHVQPELGDNGGIFKAVYYDDKIIVVTAVPGTYPYPTPFEESPEPTLNVGYAIYPDTDTAARGLAGAVRDETARERVRFIRSSEGDLMEQTDAYVEGLVGRIIAPKCPTHSWMPLIAGTDKCERCPK